MQRDDLIGAPVGPDGQVLKNKKFPSGRSRKEVSAIRMPSCHPARQIVFPWVTNLMPGNSDATGKQRAEPPRTTSASVGSGGLPQSLQAGDGRKDGRGDQHNYPPINPRWPHPSFNPRPAYGQPLPRAASSEGRAFEAGMHGLSRKNSQDEARQFSLSQMGASQDRKPSPAGQRSAQNPAPRFGPASGTLLGPRPAGRGLPLSRGPPIQQPNIPGRPSVRPRQGDQGQPRALPERRSSGPYPTEAHGSGPRFLPPDLGRPTPSQPRRPLSMEQKQIPPPRSGESDERQLSRAGEQLLMLVRLGDLKLPATVRKPKPVGAPQALHTSRPEPVQRKQQSFKPFKNSKAGRPPPGSMKKSLSGPLSKPQERPSEGHGTKPPALGLPVQGAHAPPQQRQAAQAPSRTAPPSPFNPGYIPPGAEGAHSLLQAIANGERLHNTSWRPPSIVTGNLGNRDGSSYKGPYSAAGQHKPSLVRSGATALRHDKGSAPQRDSAPLRQSSAPGPQAWDQASSQPYRVQAQPVNNSQAAKDVSTPPRPNQASSPEPGASLPRMATAPPAAAPVAGQKRPEPEATTDPLPPPAIGVPAVPLNKADPATLEEPGGMKSYPSRKPVICNGNKGIYIVNRQVICCLCNQCSAEAKARGLEEMELSPTDFERHSGSHSSKKWKSTVKILEEDAYGTFPGINVGSWLEQNVPDISRPRGKLHTYSSVFGDVAPSGAPSKRTASNNKRKRASAGMSTETTPPAGMPTKDSATPPADFAEAATNDNISTPERPASIVEGDRKTAQGEEVAGVTAAGLTGPSGKKWLAAGEEEPEVDIPPGIMREGSEYQAQIPPRLSKFPTGREHEHPRAGLPGPSSLEALAIAAGFEKDASDSLHIDAVADLEYHPGQAHDVRNVMVERGQRSRRRPRWLNEDADKLPIRPSVQKLTPPPESPLVLEEDDELPPLTWGPRPFKRRRYQQADLQRRVRTVGAGDVSRGKLVKRDAGLGVPRLSEWQLLNDGYLRVTLENDGQLFTGVLMPSTERPPRDITLSLELEKEDLPIPEKLPPISTGNSDSASEHWTESRAGADSKASSGWNNGQDPGLPVEGHEEESFRVEKTSKSPKKAGTVSNRRIIANQDYERLKVDGPPAGARCALCHVAADPNAKGAFRMEDAGDDVDFSALDRWDEGMGPFLLVRASAIMNAWVHMQCALWSPEVYVTNEGTVERASDATRRGRMIKCKMCGEKGATLGCHKRSCRASFHLSCARYHGCLLKGLGDEPYLVTCPEHSKIQNELDLVPQMPLMPDQRISPDFPPPRSNSSRLEKSGSGGGGGGNNSKTLGRQTGWNNLPKMTSNLDTLTAAALASSGNSNVNGAVNPLSASHFGGTVGQSNLRPGRCAVCIVQRKGVCGTQTAPKKCLRRIALTAIGKEIPSAPPGWRTRRPVAHWPAAPKEGSNDESLSPEDTDQQAKEEEVEDSAAAGRAPSPESAAPSDTGTASHSNQQRRRSSSRQR